MPTKNDGLAQLKRENRAVELRHHEGLTFEKIAEELGYASVSGARDCYRRGLKRIEILDPEEYLKEDLEILDVLKEVFFKPAAQGHVRSAEMLMRILDKRDDLLGLNAPKRIKAEVINYEKNGSLDAEVLEIARIIDYIEGVTADITTLPERDYQSEQSSVAEDGETGATTT
jgi:hypothetical protein